MTLAQIARVLLCGLALAAPAYAADWPQWCGTDGKNMVSAEKNVPDDFYPGDKNPQGGLKLETARGVRWATRVGSYTCVSPTVAGDRVLIGSALNGKGLLKCLDVKTGRQLWQWIAPPRPGVPKKWEGRAMQFSNFPRTLGLLSTPAIEDGRVYIVSHRNEVVCLDLAGNPDHPRPADPQTTATLKPEEANTSKVLWTFDMWDKVGSRPSDVCNGSILIQGDYLYVPTSNGVDRDCTANTHDELRPVFAPEAPSLIVLEKKTGRLVAQDDLRIGAGGRLMHGQWSSPSAGRVGGKDLVFFCGGDGMVYAFEALRESPRELLKLKPVWSLDAIPTEYKEEYKKFNITPIHHYCLGDKRRSDALNKKSDGSFMGMCEIIATPVFHEGRLYVAIGRDPDHGRGRGALWCIDPSKTGDITASGRIWCYQGLDRSISTVSIADGLLYIVDMAGRLHCLEAATGKPLWVHETKAQTWGSTLVADGKVFLPTFKGLFVFAAGREDNLLRQIDLGVSMHCSPVVANGTLYVASKSNLWAVGR